MSQTEQISGADVGERLRNAAEFEPRRLPRLKHMAETWAASAATKISAIAGASLDLTLREVESDFGPELDEAEDDGTMYAPLSSPRFRSPGYAMLDHEALEALISALFAAEPSPPGTPPRTPTDLDRSIVKLGLATIADSALSVFEMIGELRLSVGNIINAAELGEQLAGETDRFILFRFDLTVASLSTTITFALPGALFAPHLRFLREPPKMPPPDREESWSNAIKESFAKSDLRLSAIVTKKKIDLGTIAGFAVGDTIPLDVSANSLIAIECEDQPLFRAHMGRSRDSYVVRIEERIDPAEEFIDDILST